MPRAIAFGGLLVFCGLVASALAWTVPVIEANLSTKATDALRQRNITFAHVEADGRDLVVTGEAPSELIRQQARRIVASTPGQRVVLDRMTVSTATPPSPAPPPPSAVVETATRADGLSRKDGACQDAVDALLTGTKIEFEMNSTRLTVDTEPLVDELAEVLDECPTTAFEIGGHTDSQGGEAVNRRISERRAQAVRDALVARGIAADRLEAIGYGPSKPIASNNTLSGKAQNRRIEVRVRRKD